jgi:ribonuclease P protein component
MPPIFLYLFFEIAGIFVIILKPLIGRDSFTTVFKTGKKFYDGDCLGVFIYADADVSDICFNKCRDTNTYYYGVSAGKRNIKKAVLRNRVKRLIRESVRQVFDSKYNDIDDFFIKYTVFSWRKSPQKQSLIKLSDVYPSIERILLAAENYYTNRSCPKK